MQQQEEEKELQLLIQNKQRTHQRLQHPNQHMPSQRLKMQHQYQHLKIQVARTRLQMSILSVAFCIVGYLGLRYWIAVAIPVGPMSSYASAFGGGFPPDFGLQIFAIAFFGLLCITLLERINPDIARRINEEYRRTKSVDAQVLEKPSEIQVD
ncbi:MAG: hypothetical protein ACQCN6_03735 [Candidatus Bathyarchaeia archaeon]